MKHPFFNKVFFCLFFFTALLFAETEPNNSFSQASSLGPNSSDSGSLNASTDTTPVDNYDWWKVVIPADGVLTIETTSGASLDLDITIYDGNGSTYFSYSSSRTNTTETASDHLLAGTYYVLVSRYTGTGSYTIKSVFTQAALANDTEPNDSFSQGIPLSPNFTTTGHLGFFNANKTDYYDWWKIIIPDDGVLTIETISDATLDLDLTIYDGNGSTYFSYGSKRGTTDETVTDHLLAGTYYVLANRYTGFGSYTIKSIFTKTVLANDTEPNDSYSQGISLAPNSTTTGHLGFFNANKTDYYDWWKIIIPNDGVLTIETISDATLDLDLTIYDNNGSTYFSMGSTRGTTTETVSDHLIAGTYYVLANRHTGFGSYTIKSIFAKASLDDDAEPNDQVAAAINLGPNSTDTGHLGYFNAGKTDYYDWWKITIPSDGKLSIETNSDATLDVDLTIYDVNGSTYISYGYLRNNTKETVTHNSLMPGTYFIQASRYSGYGSYEIKSVFTPTSYSNDTEPNDKISQAITILPNTLMTGHIGFYSNAFTDNTDYYVVTLPTNWDSLYVRTDSDPTLDIDLNLYNSSSNFLTYASVRNNTREILGYKNAALYYIQVVNYSGYGSYGIKISGTYPKDKVTGVESAEQIPTAYKLQQNYPNPFNPSTKIQYELPEAGKVVLKVFDILGREVRTLVDMNQSAGYYEVNFNGEGLSNGIFIYTIKTEKFNQTKKMLLLK